MVRQQKILGMFYWKCILHLIVLHIENGLTEQPNFNQLYTFGSIVVQSTNNSQLVRRFWTRVSTKSQLLNVCLFQFSMGLLTTSIIHEVTQGSSLLQLIMTSFSNLWWFCRKVFDANKITNSADNLIVGCIDKNNVSSALLMSTRIKWTIYAWKIQLTSRAFTRSSLVCEAEMQIRALARRRGVAGNATVTTATWNISILLVPWPWQTKNRTDGANSDGY